MARGAKNNQNGGEKFLTFMSGKFVERVDENTTGAIARQLEKGPNVGTTVYELQYEGYEGQIYDVQTEAGDYGTRLHIFMDVSTEEEPEAKVRISLPLSSGPAKGFLGRLPIIDFNKDVLLKGYHIKNDTTGRFNSYLVPYQDGQKLESYYTKANPNGLPDMQQIKVKGSLVWDDTEQLEFFEQLIKNTPFPGRSKELADEVEPEPEHVEEGDVTPKRGSKQAF